MPNVKIFVDDALYPATRTALSNALVAIRDMLCADLNVPVSACQFAVMPVLAMPDLPRVNVEIQILPRPERTKALVTDVCSRLRDLVQAATGTHVAVRASALDPETYIALK